MRLTHQQIQAFHQALSDLQINQYKLFLFGSRRINEAKGGDIDLVLIVEENLKPSVLENKFAIVARMKWLYEDEKIDLTIASPIDLQNNEFLISIKNDLVQI
ncbi:MAG: nucleotidyltransferase domain-containing protein [Pseudobdellovibrionaceae bacterium]